jgi:hypothetical protein
MTQSLVGSSRQELVGRVCPWSVSDTSPLLIIIRLTTFRLLGTFVVSLNSSPGGQNMIQNMPDVIMYVERNRDFASGVDSALNHHICIRR